MKNLEIIEEIRKKNSNMSHSQLKRLNKAKLMEILNSTTIIEKEPESPKLIEIKENIKRLEDIRKKELVEEKKTIDKKPKGLSKKVLIEEIFKQKISNSSKYCLNKYSREELNDILNAGRIIEPEPVKLVDIKIKKQKKPKIHFVREELIKIEAKPAIPEPEPQPEPIKKKRKERLIEFSDTDEEIIPEVKPEVNLVNQIVDKVEVPEVKERNITDIRNDIKELCKEFLNMVKHDIQDFKRGKITKDELINNYNELNDEMNEELHHIIGDFEIPKSLDDFIDRTFTLTSDKINNL